MKVVPRSTAAGVDTDSILICMALAEASETRVVERLPGYQLSSCDSITTICSDLPQIAFNN